LLNDAGHYYPLWSTCAGFQYLVALSSDEGWSVLTDGLGAENMTLPLDFVGNPTSSKMFGDLGYKA
jgi:hypothetical protein